ncbi:MAG TPA: hypothetical protein VMB03_03755 [Bryobacteraceae bacterium]|nr:hypothetical protein [Bryobacteraceae bacterium]
MIRLQRHLPPVVALAALNGWICAPLLAAGYTNQFSSIDGAFISIARYLSRHWSDHSWWPIWHCGMPYEDTYVPLLHLIVAGLASSGRISAAHAYHIVVGTAYVLGPVTLYLMAVYLGAGRGAALLSAAIYSLFSPSVLLMPAVARDLGGFWFGRRMQILTVYGEGPHISAMTLLPVAIAALAYALEKRTGRSFALATTALAVIFLVNVPGTMATGVAVFCWLVVQPAGSRRAAWAIAAGAAALAYALACHGIPPSSELVVLHNVGPMHRGFSAAAKSAPVLLLALLGAAAAAGYRLSRTRVPLLLRFAILYFVVTAAVVLTASPAKFEMLPQGGRLQLEMEMAICLIAGIGLWHVYRRAPWRLRLILALVLAIGAGYQLKNYRSGADIDTRPANLAARSEHASAMWADANLAGERVYVTGSDSFWWNTFTDVPQVIGCCDQGESLSLIANVHYLVDPPAGPYHEILTKAYLEALGAQAIVVSGPQSTDTYKDIQAPERFDSMFPVLHRELGDTIYAVPQRSTSLAHVVHLGETVPTNVASDALPYKIYAYSLVIEDPTRPAADFQWLSDGVAHIRAQLKREDLISLQVPWFSGWKAFVGGRPIPVSPDGIGFQVLHPACDGACEIALRWTGRPDRIPSAILSLGALAFLAVLCAKR